MATTSNTNKTLVVIGATGNQGYSVAETFLSSGHWHVRGMTRTPSSAAAQKLSDIGAEVVQGDLYDRESLSKAFDSAQAIFANTDFWATYYDPSTPDKAAATGQSVGKYTFDVEVSHGKNIADAAAGVASLEHFVFSALPPMDKVAAGQVAECYHWDSKAAILAYIHTTHPNLAAKMSTIYLGSYTTNPFIVPRWDQRSRSYKIMIPMGPKAILPIVDPTKSTGALVQAVIDSEGPGTHLLAYDTGSKLTMPQVADIWSRVTGKEVGFERTTVEYMNKEFGIPLEILAGPVLIDRNHYMYGVDAYIEPPQLKGKVQTPSYEEWLASHWRELLPSEEHGQ